MEAMNLGNKDRSPVGSQEDQDQKSHETSHRSISLRIVSSEFSFKKKKRQSPQMGKGHALNFIV